MAEERRERQILDHINAGTNVCVCVYPVANFFLFFLFFILRISSKHTHTHFSNVFALIFARRPRFKCIKYLRLLTCKEEGKGKACKKLFVDCNLVFPLFFLFLLFSNFLSPKFWQVWRGKQASKTLLSHFLCLFGGGGGESHDKHISITFDKERKKGADVFTFLSVCMIGKLNYLCRCRFCCRCLIDLPANHHHHHRRNRKSVV